MFGKTLATFGLPSPVKAFESGQALDQSHGWWCLAVALPHQIGFLFGGWSQVSALRGQGASIRSIAATLKKSPTTIHKLVRAAA
jgi:hypothetical protein